jgi:hypothetical protein
LASASARKFLEMGALDVREATTTGL